MLIKNNYHLGILHGAYILWNDQKIVYLIAKNLQSAMKESKKILAQN